MKPGNLHKYFTAICWMAMAIITWILFVVVEPTFMDQWYRSGLFVLVRRLFDSTLGIIPISPLVILIILGIVWLFITARKPFSIKGVLLNTLKICSIIFTLFYWLWGFNYACPSYVEKLKWNIQPPAMDVLYSLFDNEVRELERLRKGVFTISDLESLLYSTRKRQKNLLKKYGYTAHGQPVIRILPKGVLLRFSTAGMYNPFLGEGYIDGGLHELEKPFVLAHELSHAYGVTDEGEANFWGLLTCLASEDPFVQYSGRLSLFRYILSDVRKADPELYSIKWDSIPVSVRSDLDEINKNHLTYPDILPDFRNFIYGFYLQSNGVAQGLNSYNELVSYYLYWTLSQGNTQGR